MFVLSSDFITGFPGVLEPTSFREVRPGGIIADSQGLAFVPNELPPQLPVAEFLEALQEVLLRAERALSHLDGIASRLDSPDMLISPFQLREARLSSAIEDTFASTEQMALFDLDPSAVAEDARSEVREVNNYAGALKFAFLAPHPICIRLLREVRARLMDGVERSAGRRGEFRTTQNAIGAPGASFESARFVPPPPRHVERLLQNWEIYANAADVPLPRLMRFAIAHYQFEVIHPFDDGNGRVGRLLIALQLCQHAQLSRPLAYVSGYLERHRSRYYDLLHRVSTRGEWMEWIRFFLTAVAEQAEDAAARCSSLADLRSRYHDMVREKRASALLPAVIDGLFENPALSVSSVCDRAKVTPAAAQRLIRRLEEKGIVSEVTGRKSRRLYVAREVLEVVGD